MEIIQFNGKTYGKENTQLYVFEDTWDTFRPITKAGWDGKKIAIDDFKYKNNLFDPFYGFGSAEMKSYCKNLTEITELENANKIESSTDFWKWCGTPTEWFRDRQCVILNQCAVQEWKKYVSYTNSKPRTLRHAPSKRVTRRLLRK